MRTLSDKQDLHKHLEPKAESAAREEKVQLRKDGLKLKLIWKSERWEQKSPEEALYVTHRELAHQSFTAPSSELMGGSGSKREDELMWRLGHEKPTIQRESHEKLSKRIIMKNLL